MVYLENNGMAKQLDFLENLSGIEGYVVCLWLYPESKFRHFSGVELAERIASRYSSPTTYDQEYRNPKVTKPCAFDFRFVDFLRRNKRTLRSDCSSLTLHIDEEEDWDFCMYFGEGVSLIKNKEIEDFAKKNMLKVSDTPPPWW